MSQHETAKEEFDRLCSEMHLGRPLYMMSRSDVESKPNDWYVFRHHGGRERFMAVIDARERMERETPIQNGKSRSMHPLWKQSNERLLAERDAMMGDSYGQL